jgi:hypothetical protein
MAWQNAAYLHQVQYNAKKLFNCHLTGGFWNTVFNSKMVVLKPNLGNTDIASNQAIL